MLYIRLSCDCGASKNLMAKILGITDDTKSVRAILQNLISNSTIDIQGKYYKPSLHYDEIDGDLSNNKDLTALVNWANIIFIQGPFLLGDGSISSFQTKEYQTHIRNLEPQKKLVLLYFGGDIYSGVPESWDIVIDLYSQAEPQKLITSTFPEFFTPKP